MDVSSFLKLEERKIKSEEGETNIRGDLVLGLFDLIRFGPSVDGCCQPKAVREDRPLTARQ